MPSRLGEICGAVFCGVLSFNDGLQIACVRGSLVETLEAGGMMAISTSQEIINPLIETFNSLHSPQWIDLSAANTLDQSVVSGMKDSLAAFKAFLLSAYPSMKVRLLRTRHAFHSRQFDKLLGQFETHLKTISFHLPACTFVSSVSGEVVNEFSSIYWVNNLRQPVLFQKGIQTLLNLPRPPKIFIEIGPRPILLNFVSSVGPDDLVLCPTLRPADQECWPTLLKSLGKLYSNWNGEINWARLNEGRAKETIDLPFYPFERKVYNIAEPGGTPFGEHDVSHTRSTEVSPVILEPFCKNGRVPGFHKENWIQASPSSKVQTHLEINSKSNRAGIHPRSVWLIFTNKSTNGVAVDLRDLILERHGNPCVLLRPSTEFNLTENEVTLDPHHFPHWEILAAQGWSVEGVICLWGMNGESEISLNESKREFIGGFLNVLKLVGQLVVPEKVVLVTDGALWMDGDPPMRVIDLLRTTLHGMLKTFATENPGIAVTGIDLDPNSQLIPSNRATHIFDQLGLAGIERELAIRQGKVYCARLVSFNPVLPVVSGERNLLYAENSYLVTGGLGGIGMQVAAWLLDRGAGKVILAGRRQPTDSAVIDKLKEFGEAASVVLIDVSDTDAVRSLFAKFGTIFPSLKGIFHAAGLLRHGTIPVTTLEGFEDVFKSKGDGTLNLHRESLGLNLDHFVLFSSIASNLGLAGRVAYTAANQFLDTFAKNRVRALGLPTLSINLSGWSDVGFASRLLAPAQLSRMNELTGLDWFKAEEGIRALERAIRLGLEQVTVADIYVSEVLETIHPRLGPYLSQVVSCDKKDDRKFILKESGFNVIKKMVEELRGAEGGKKRFILERIIEKCFRIYMALSEDEVVDRAQNLTRYGMDSLMETQITNRLTKELGIVIPRSKISLGYTIASIADTFLKAL